MHPGGFIKRFIKPHLLRSVSALALALAGGAAFLYVQIDRQAQTDEARPADAIIVLGSSVWPGERASPSLQARTRKAIRLYQAGYAPALIFCGGLGDYPPTEAEMMRRLAQRAGIPDQAMELDETSYSTEENLGHAKQIMDAHGWRTALIVSDPFHLLRAKTIAGDLGIEAYGSPASDSPTYTTLRLRVWYTSREVLGWVWYQATRALGEPLWLYRGLKQLGL